LVDDEMTTNGNDASRHYQDALQAQMGERVTNLGRRVTDIEGEMRAGFRQIESSISALTTTLAERAKPQWQAIGVALTFCALLGGLAYMPIREATSDLKAAVKDLAATSISRQEMDWRAARSQEDRGRTDASIADLRTNTVGRAEWTERNRARDQEVTDLNRRVDELRQDVGSVYGTRDVIQDMKKEIDGLRQRIASQRYSRTPP
jgi:hypothetical protein